jgi:rod shape determining protein RodA
MSRYISFRDFDWVLLGFVLLICTFGILEIYSATLTTNLAGKHLHVSQIYWVVAGVGLMFVMSLLNYQVLLENVHWLYLGSLGSLLAVLIFGTRYLGAKRWIRLPGGMHFQPSEWVKLILILAMARYFAEFRQREMTIGELVKAGLVCGVPFFLVLVQPDLGTSLTYIPIAFMALFLGGMKGRHMALLLVLASLAAPLAWKHMKPYQRARLASFVNPEQDSQGAGYQVEQSLIAVGQGGLTGRGFARGSQTQGSFIPEPHNDFIFAAWSEEHGFVGAMTVLLLYFVVLMRLVHNAQTAPDRAGAFVVMGVVAVLTFHILINVGMVVGFMPVTGIPLPLMSYGGSSVLFTFLALGIVNNIRMRRFVN